MQYLQEKKQKGKGKDVEKVMGAGGCCRIIKSAKFVESRDESDQAEMSNEDVVGDMNEMYKPLVVIKVLKTLAGKGETMKQQEKKNAKSQEPGLLKKEETTASK